MVPELLQLASPANVSGTFLSGATSLCIFSGVGWPSSHSGSFRVLIDAEIVRLRGASGLVFTVVERGAEGTVQSDHQEWSRALHIITAQGAKNLTGGINRQSGATYTFGQTDARSLVVFRTSGVALASGSIPQSTSGDTTDFGPNWWTVVLNLGSGDLHLSPASGTINGVAGLTLTGGANKGAFIFSPGTVAGDYAAIVTQMSGGGGASLTSGIIVSGLIGNVAVNSGNLASGAVGWPHMASGYAVGQSGIIIDYTQGPPVFGLSGSFAGTTASGGGYTLVTEEVISGVRAVQISQSGRLRVAMASVSGRMPAFGVVVDNVASGAAATVYDLGSWDVRSGMADYSGYLGSLVYVGRSGQIVTASGSWNSGGFFTASGDQIQSIGVAEASGRFNLGPGGPPIISGSTVQAQQVQYSGVGLTATTEETISGIRAVNISQSGYARVAMASVSGRMPAAGVCVGNFASGVTATIFVMGVFQASSGLVDYSGYVGRSVYVGRSGQVVTMSGSWNSGGLIIASGDMLQEVGVILNSGSFVVN